MPTQPDQEFLELLHHPIKSRLFLLQKIPSAFFSGVRVLYADENKAIVSIPYKWFSSNPFKSTYFACLSMAAELSTGILATIPIYKQEPAVSMLITKSEASFLKKAKGLTTFVCEDGQAIRNAIKEAMSSGKTTSIASRSIGKDDAGNVVAEFIFTWSFKVK